MKKILLTIIMMGLSSIAFAKTAPTSSDHTTYQQGIYLGLQGGYAMSHWDSLNDAVDPSRIISLHAAEDDFIFQSGNVVGRVYVGYDFHKNFAVEAGYTMMPTSAKYDTGRYSNFPIPTDEEPDTWAVDLVGKVKAKVIGNLGVYAKFGVDYISVDSSPADYYYDKVVKTNQPNKEGDSKSAINAVYGVGVSYNFTPHIAADVSWTRYGGHSKIGKDYIPYADVFMLGASYKFNI